MRRILILFAFAVLISTPMDARWTRAGLHGADVRALVIHPTEPDLVFLGTSQGELYVSRDGAKSWENPRGGIPFPGYVVDTLTIDARGRLWVACWGLWGGGAIAVSADHGVTWSRRDAGLENVSIRALANDPQNPETIIAGGLDGVYRSIDDGRTWAKLSEHENVESLAIDPRMSERIYVGTWRQAWRTDDGGKSWKHIEKGMVLDTDVFAFNLDSRNPDNIWIATCGWVYNSPDRGDTWTRYRDGFNNRRVHAVDYDPLNANCVYAGSVGGLYRTLDSGKSWQVISDENLVVNAIAIHPERPHRIILGTEGDGVYVSPDRGKSFARSNRGLYNVKVTALVPDTRVPNRLYAAVMFGGAASGVYRSIDGGKNWDRLSATPLPEVLSLVMQDNVDVRFLAGTERGFFWSRDGIEWTQAKPFDQPIRVDKILPYNAVRMFAATGDGVFTSKDSGRSWYRLGALQGKTLDIALGRFGDARALYALTQEGLSWFDGQAWNAVEDAPLGGHSLAVRSERDADTLVVAGSAGVFAGRINDQGVWIKADGPEGSLASVHQSAGPPPHVFVNLRDPIQLLVWSDEGRSWRRLPMPMAKQIATVATDPFRAKRYYLGTIGQGVFIWDEGEAASSRAGTYVGGGTK
jgi:photosystem II stability/assembly factor-like uncharacterized protein